MEFQLIPLFLAGCRSSTPTKSAACGGARPGRNGDARRLALAAGGDPNDWYRHDHGSEEATGAAGRRPSGPGKDGGVANGDAAPLWFASDGVWHDKADTDNGETVGKASTFSPKYVIIGGGIFD